MVAIWPRIVPGVFVLVVTSLVLAASTVRWPLWPGPLWHDFVAAFWLLQTAVFATSIYLHRALAHGSIKLSAFVESVFELAIVVTTGQKKEEWVAVHRKHHTFTDREGDPHSPLLLGFWRVQFFNVVYYMREAKNRETQKKFAPDISDAEIYRWGLLWPVLGTIGLVAVFGWWEGPMIAAIHGVLYVFVLAPLINGLGHWAGQTNFDNPGFNCRWLAWFTGGESLHNNHHAHPKSARFSMARGEFDPPWMVIRSLVAAGMTSLTGEIVKYAIGPRGVARGITEVHL